MNHFQLSFFLGLAILFSGCGKTNESVDDVNTELELARLEAEKARAEADKAKAEADKQKAKADEAKAKAHKANATIKEDAQPSKKPVDQAQLAKKQLEELILKIRNRRKVEVTQSGRPLNMAGGRCTKSDWQVTEVSYDITKTESIVSPFIGNVTVMIEQTILANVAGDSIFVSVKEAKAADHSLRLSYKQITGHYAWQDKKWIFKYHTQWPKDEIKKHRQVWPFTDKLVGEKSLPDGTLVLEDTQGPRRKYAFVKRDKTPIDGLAGMGFGSSSSKPKISKYTLKSLKEETHVVATDTKKVVARIPSSKGDLKLTNTIFSPKETYLYVVYQVSTSPNSTRTFKDIFRLADGKMIRANPDVDKHFQQVAKNVSESGGLINGFSYDDRFLIFDDGSFMQMETGAIHRTGAKRKDLSTNEDDFFRRRVFDIDGTRLTSGKVSGFGGGPGFGGGLLSESGLGDDNSSPGGGLLSESGLGDDNSSPGMRSDLLTEDEKYIVFKTNYNYTENRTSLIELATGKKTIRVSNNFQALYTSYLKAKEKSGVKFSDDDIKKFIMARSNCGLAFSESGKLFATCNSTRIVVYELPSMKQVASTSLGFKIDPNYSQGRSLSFSGNDRLILE